jgi:hypothetical protein
MKRILLCIYGVEFGLRRLQQDGEDVHLDEIVRKCDSSYRKN